MIFKWSLLDTGWNTTNSVVLLVCWQIQSLSVCYDNVRLWTCLLCSSTVSCWCAYITGTALTEHSLILPKDSLCVKVQRQNRPSGRCFFKGFSPPAVLPQQRSQDVHGRCSVLLCLSERVSETVPARVQGGCGEEVTLHPAALQHLQGCVGLADPAGHLLRGRGCALWYLLCQSRWRQRLSLAGQPQHYWQRHCSGDALHNRYNSFSIF